MTSRAFLKRWQRAGITAAIAYALVVQALLSSLGGVLHAQAAGLPQNVICAQDGDRTAPGDPHAPASAHNALCCILSCGVSPPMPAPAFVSIATPAIVAALVIFRPETPVSRLSSDVLPVGSRAPPRLG